MIEISTLFDGDQYQGEENTASRKGGKELWGWLSG